MAGDEAGNDHVDALAAYADYVGEQVAEESARKHSVEQRAAIVISTSAALIALLFGGIALGGPPEAPGLPPGVIVVLLVGVGGFVGAAVLGIAATWPRDYSEPTVRELRRVLSEVTTGDAATALRQVAESQLATLKTARGLNDTKMRLLAWALRFEVSALVFVALAVALAV